MVRAALRHFDGDRPDVIAYDVATSHAGRILRRLWDRPAIQLNPVFVQNDNFSFAEGYAENGEYSGPTPEQMGAWAGRIM